MPLIEVLGPGCRRCAELDRLVREIAAAYGVEAEIRYVTEPAEIVSRGFFMHTPALVVDGTVVSTGRVPGRREIAGWITTIVPQEVHP